MLSSAEISKKWESIARAKTGLPFTKCLLMAVLAGLYIALGAIGATLIQASAGAEIGKLLGACVFPTGLILIVTAGGELFTGNCLMAGPLVNGKVPLRGALRNLSIVYLGNALGALLGAVIAVCGGVLLSGGEKTVALAASIAESKVSLSFADALLKGIGCNVLVCGAVYAATGAESGSGKAVLAFFPVMLFVLCGLEHCVANMYYIPAALLMKALPRYAVSAEKVTVSAYLVKNLLPVTLGNVLGGFGLAVCYAVIHREKATTKS